MNRALFNALIEGEHPLRQNLMEFDTHAAAKRIAAHLDAPTKDIHAAPSGNYIASASRQTQR
jgi:hypothetical protein